MSTSKKLILVIGATGAQGRAVIDALLAPTSDGTTSPYSVRALTRNVNSSSAKEIAAIPGAEVFQGSFTDFGSVYRALEGCYGAYVNTDGFTEGEQGEIFAGLRIFELAKQKGTLKHFVWSNLDYIGKITGYNPKYRAEHYDGKGRVLEFIKGQPSEIDGMVWSSLTTGPYMEMLAFPTFGPIHDSQTETYFFAAPIGQGHVPLIALKDLGYFARYIFDHREEFSAQDLQVTSDIVSWSQLAETFTKATGKRAKFIDVPIEGWLGLLKDTDKPLANKFYDSGSTEHTTWAQNFTNWWNLYHDDIIKRDLDAIKKIHPGLRSVEAWMVETKYDGSFKNLLKNSEEGKGASFNPDAVPAVLAQLRSL
ncbi:nmrA-family protein [Sistotremastrum suecicum HHB10207 ss-3]|uniref:NmrA-family protein n=1 Tax=Sistotremastrum suecicum HHB10207 ss-3 TaxID=1314776 RepID=A0A166BHF5_9AGAM|nr:nmrA-family protein [Sistotremastrum suecicum HHB10207 ss-3]